MFALLFIVYTLFCIPLVASEHATLNESDLMAVGKQVLFPQIITIPALKRPSNFHLVKTSSGYRICTDEDIVYRTAFAAAYTILTPSLINHRFLGHKNRLTCTIAHAYFINRMNAPLKQIVDQFIALPVYNISLI